MTVADNKPEFAFAGKGIKHLPGDQKELANLQRELGKVKIEPSQVNSLIIF